MRYQEIFSKPNWLLYTLRTTGVHVCVGYLWWVWQFLNPTQLTLIRNFQPNPTQPIGVCGFYCCCEGGCIISIAFKSRRWRGFPGFFFFSYIKTKKLIIKKKNRVRCGNLWELQILFVKISWNQQKFRHLWFYIYYRL